MKSSTPLSKIKVKYLQSLRQKKYRQKYNKFIVEGDKIALELLHQSRFAPELILATASWIETNQQLLAVHHDKTLEVNEAELKSVSGLSTPQKVLIVADIFTWPFDWNIAANGFSLYLDGIRDPGNMGTIIRIADWFAFDYIFCSPDCVDVFNPKVIQAAMGAFLRVIVVEKSLSEIKAQCPNLPIFGTVLEGENVFEIDLPKQALLVVGNEGQGINTETMALLDHKIRIPAAAGGGAESLNAAVATGIFCALFRNHRNP